MQSKLLSVPFPEGAYTVYFASMVSNAYKNRKHQQLFERAEIPSKTLLLVNLKTNQTYSSLHENEIPTELKPYMKLIHQNWGRISSGDVIDSFM